MAAKIVFVKVLTIQGEIGVNTGSKIVNIRSILGRDVLLLIRRSQVRVLPGAPLLYTLVHRHCCSIDMWEG